MSPVQILGFCTGLLPASAVVAARDTTELYNLACDIVSITFRMAWEVLRRMTLIEQDSAAWGRTYVDLSQEKVQGILDEFHESNVSRVELLTM
jgi:hypothetical protein